MATACAQTPLELIFPPQAAFSWTLRWARAHRSDEERAESDDSRIAGSARTPDEPSGAVAFADLPRAPRRTS